MQADGPGESPGIDQGRGRGTSQPQIRGSRRALLVLVVALVVGGVATAGAVFESSGGSSSPTDDPIAGTALTTASASSSTTSTTTTTTALPPTTAAPRPTPTLPPEGPLSQPEPSPSDPYARVPVNQVGQVVIPKIGLDTPYYEGVWLTVIDVGPGHWPGTANAGGWGNMVLAGHRVTHTHPFRNIDQLVAGDDILVRVGFVTYDYKVTSTQVVTPDALWIVDQTPGRSITLFACHPPGSATYRYVVHGTLAGVS